MSKMKSMLGMYALAAMAMNGDLGGNNRERYTKETEEERKARLAKAEIERNKANGLKEFFYGENSVWAINQKNADRKARLAKAEIERNKANGLKEFFYGENSVWAINQKNADRKARSKHWL